MPEHNPRVRKIKVKLKNYLQNKDNPQEETPEKKVYIIKENTNGTTITKSRREGSTVDYLITFVPKKISTWILK